MHKCDTCQYKGEHQEMGFKSSGVCRMEHDLLKAMLAYRAPECPFAVKKETQREKMVELLKTTIHLGLIFPDDYEVAADHLLANGVTIREPLKPLTVEETLKKRVVYLEFKHLLLQEPVVMFRAWNEWEDAEIIHYDRFGCQYSNIDCEEKDYGKKWRCWAEKPTEEERKAAEWLK